MEEEAKYLEEAEKEFKNLQEENPSNSWYKYCKVKLTFKIHLICLLKKNIIFNLSI